MALPSSKYAEDESAKQTLANGTVLHWTNQVGALYNLNDPTDLSICYTNWNDPNILTKATKTLGGYFASCDLSEPDMGLNDSVSNDKASGWTRTKTNSPRIEDIYAGVVIANNAGYHYWGYSPLASSKKTDGSGNTARFLLDMDVNKMLFKITITAVDKTTMPTTDDYDGNWTSKSISTTTITLKQLYENPTRYLIISYSWGGALVYGENTSDHWRNVSSIYPAFILDNGDSVGGFIGKSVFGSYVGTANLSFSTSNGHVSSGGGSSTYNICSHLDEMYVMGHPFEFTIKPDPASYQTLGSQAQQAYTSKYGTTVATHTMYVGCNLIDVGDAIAYFGQTSLECQYYTNPDPNLVYRKLHWSWNRYIKGEKFLAYLAAFGLYFLNDNSYDPDSDNITPDTLGDTDKIWLGEMLGGGVTTGRWITDLDSYSGPNKNGKTSNPDYDPSGGGGGGYEDDPWHGINFSGVGVGGAGAFAKCYYMTSTELANLRSWMNSINVPEGFDPMQQIIGLSQVPVALSGSGPENVVFVNSSAVYDPGVTTRAVDTGVATQQAMGTPISYYLGSVDIVRRMRQRGEPYLDYDCQIELYLPLIGMFSLDTQAVMGRTIYAYAILDPVSGTLAAYAYVSKEGQNLPVAYGSTTIGVDLPISAQQLSVSRAALKQANAQLGASLLSGALTMLAAASSGKASGTGAKTSTGSSGLSAAGIREAGSDYMKASQVGNVFGDFMQWGRTIRQLSYGNNTAIAGSFGGSTAQWSYPFTPYVKIIRPRFEKPSNYAHSQGVPCVQTKTIGSCTGFVQCIGADVSGITGATDLELQAIQAALSNGIYAGGGS